MKKLLGLTTTLILLMFLGGNTWGQTTVSYDFSDGGAVTGLNEASPGIALDANIGFGSFRNSGTANPALNSGQLRLYQNATKGGSIKIYASNGVTITQVIVHASGTTGPAAYTVDGGSATDLSAGTTYTMSSLSATSVVEFYQKDGNISNRIYVDDFEVTYTAGGSTPTITLSETTLTGFTYVEGSGPSTEQTFTVGGTDLTNDISIAASTNYEISKTSGSGYTTPLTFVHTGGTVTTQTVYVRLKADLSAGDYNSEDITASSTGATNKTVTCSGSVTSAGGGGGMEDFTNSNATSSYLDNSFVGNNGITWTYVESRDANGDLNGSGIDLPALMLRQSSSSSSVTSSSISNGIGNFSVKLYKGFTGGGNRQVELFINGDSKGTSTAFDDYDEHIFEVNNINITGDIVIKISNITSKQVIVDDITWTGYSGGTGPDNPTAFSASATSSTQIDLGWTENASNDEVLIAWSSDGTFGTPVDGTTYAASSSVPGGGTSLGTDADEAYSHTSLTASTQYYYKIWSVDGSTNYSTGVEANTTTLSPEPTNHPSGFGATANSSSSITTIWSDNDGTQAAEGFLILANTSGTFSDPSDGTPQSDDNDLSDGSGQVNVAHGVETYTWNNGLSASTQYFFKIYPYSNSGSNIDFKTDGTAPTDDATTDDIHAIVINEFLADPIGAGDANGDGTTDAEDDEFIELYNNSNSAINITGYKIKDALATNHIFPINSYIEPYDVIIIFGGGTPTGFDNLDVQTASTGTLSLNNGGDDITITDDDDNVLVSYTYGSEGGTNQSITRDPDVTGSFVGHTTTTGAGAFSPIKMIDDMHFKRPTVWTGAAKSNAWATAGNWSVVVPSGANRAVIPSSLSTYPTISAAATCNTLKMKDGATLLGGEYLTVNGTARIKKNITGYTGTDDGWNIIAAPVNGMAMPGSDWVPVADEDDFYAYDEAENTWRNYLDLVNPTTWFDYFDVGTGYLTAYHTDNDGIKNFIGTLNSDASYSITLGKVNTGWNYIGNPYPSKIDGVTPSNASSMKFISAADGSYVDVGSDEIDICQGFVVFAESVGASVSAARSNQTHGSTKKAGDEINRMKILASTGENTVYAWLEINENASTAFEWQSDSRYLQPISDLPRLSMITSDDIKVSTNTLSVTEESVVIPVSFSVLQNEIITFSLEDFSGSLGVKNIILEDQVEDIFTTLSDGESYIFNATTGDDPLRFKLHVNGANGFSDLSNSDWFDIYSNGNKIYLNSNKEQNAIVNIYNTTGQLLVNKQLTVSGLTQFEVKVPSGWYVIKMLINENSFAKKVFIY